MAAKAQLPQFPGWLAFDGLEALPAQIRALGNDKADLEIDFASMDRPELVTNLLRVCLETSNGEQLPKQLLLNMPVGFRIEALLILARLSDGRPFHWTIRCGSESCGEQAEFELDLRQILELAKPTREQETVDVALGTMQITVGRPTAADQMRWLSEGDFDTAEMLRSIVRSPSLENVLATGVEIDTLVSAIENAMDDFDPLPGFHLNVVCPHCGMSNKAEPDIAGAALERLARRQHALLEDVHRLASRYHWSERQILELPEWRRRSYLDLVEEGTA